METSVINSSGERLKRARLLAGISTRREFAEKHQISTNTLQGWEQNKNPLSIKGAKRLIEALKLEGWLCSIEWLISGKGMPPRPYEILTCNGNHQHNINEEENIYNEIQLFKQQHDNIIVLSIVDDAMEPFFSLGDYIAGIRLLPNRIAPYINNFCIVELNNHIIFPRRLQAGSQTDRYTLSCANPQSSSSPLNIINTEIISASPIIWHRKKLSAMKSTVKDE